MSLSVRMERGLGRHLARLDLDAAAETALAAQAEVVAAAARAVGAEGGEVQAAGMGVLVGWRSAALRRREVGEAGVRPQPVLAPVAVALGAQVAETVGAAVADAIRGA